MSLRTDMEMAALLENITEQIGSLDRWSDPALESLNDWLADTGIAVDHEWVKRDSESEADA